MNSTPKRASGSDVANPFRAGQTYAKFAIRRGIAALKRLKRAMAQSVTSRHRYMIEELCGGATDVVRSILEGLSGWFGRTETREHYIDATAHLTTLGAFNRNGSAIGFISLKRHTAVAAEIYVMGVLREHHRCGCGRALIDDAGVRLATQGVRWLTVKTLGPSHPDPHYAGTRRFYHAVGFEPLEVFQTLWGENTPCLYMIKPLGP